MQRQQHEYADDPHDPYDSYDTRYHGDV